MTTQQELITRYQVTISPNKILLSPGFISFLDQDTATNILWQTFKKQQAEVDLNARVEDQGIGSYEFWGAKGVDSTLVIEIDPDDTIIYCVEQVTSQNVFHSFRAYDYLITTLTRLSKEDKVTRNISVGDLHSRFQAIPYLSYCIKPLNKETSQFSITYSLTAEWEEISL